MPPTHDQVLDYLYRLADTVCKEIDGFQPDLLVVLYHSAQIPLAAVSALWAETRTRPLPPVVGTNLGQEKFSEYRHSSSFLEEYDYMPELVGWPPIDGHFLAWLIQQSDLVQAVQTQVEEVVGKERTIRRILVIDDFLYGGGTKMVSLGILHHLFPGTGCHLLAGNQDGLREHFSEEWLGRFHPGLLERIKAEWKPVPDRGELRSPDSVLRWLTMGTMDVEWISPAWVPITAESERLSQLLPFLPAEEWLRLPVWMYDEIGDQIRLRVQTGVPETAKPFTLRRHTVGMACRIMGLAWQYCRLEIPVAERLGLPEDKAREELDKLVSRGYLIRCVQRDRIWYELPGGPGFLLYGPMRIDPGNEITQYAEAISLPLSIPFAVEFAHTGDYYGGAPILAVMPDLHGTSVPATLLHMDPAVDLDQDFIDFLIYPQWVLERDEEKSLTYLEVAWEEKGVIGIDTLAHFHGMDRTFFLAPVPNLAFVMDQEMSEAEKGRRLAALAVESLTELTYPSGTDGIRYLVDAINQGVETPLTTAYRDALLILADHAPDLVTARERLAARRGLGHLPVWSIADNRFA